MEHLSSIRMLVVDADSSVHDVLVAALQESQRSNHVSLVYVLSLRMALQQLQADQFDAIVLNLSLPDSNGIETLRQVQSLVDHLPVLIVTDINDELVIRTALREGAQDYLLKTTLTHTSLLRAIDYAIERNAGMNALREREARYRLMTENVTDIISRHAPDATYLYISPAARFLLGYDPDELLGNNAYILFHPDDIPVVRKAHQRILDGDETAFMSYRVRVKDERYIWLETNLRRVVDPDTGVLQEIVAVSRDVTARKETEERLRLLSVALQQTNDGIVVTSVQDEPSLPKIVFINTAFAQISGYAPEDILDKTVDVFNEQLSEPELLSSALRQVEQREAVATETTFKHRNGALHSVEWYLIPLRTQDDQITHHVFVLRDITERRRIDREREQQRVLAEALRDTIAALTSTLELRMVMARILDNVGRVVPHDAANFMIVDGDDARVIYWQGYPQGHETFFQDVRFSLTQRSLRGMVETGESFLLRSTENYPDWMIFTANNWVRSHVAVPIRIHDQTIGFLNLDSGTEDFFTREHAERLRVFADYAAIAVENAQLYETMSRYAAELAARVEQRTGELQRAKERVEAILASISDAVAVTSVDGEIQQLNPAFSLLFGSAEQDMLDRTLCDLTEDEPLLQDAITTLIGSLEPRRIELPMRKDDGSLFDADLVLSPIRNDRLNGIICSVRDISERKQMESNLRRALEREKELGILKSRFIAMASHEFRTPLATILSSSDLLKRYRERMSAHAVQEHFETIENSIRHMTQMIDDVLAIGKADEGRLSFSPVDIDLVGFCRTLIHEIEPNHEAAPRIQFESADRVFASVDMVLVRQILTNLLSNALKYSSSYSPVTFCLEREGHEIVFTVADAGIGIPEEDQPHLFDPFHRGANVGYIAGSGLGLAVLKRAVDVHRGTITVQSKENVGTTFVVRLPVVR